MPAVLGGQSLDHFTVVEYIPQPAALVDARGVIRHLSRAARELLVQTGRLEPVNLVGEHFSLIWGSPPHQTELRAFIDKVMSTDGVLETWLEEAGKIDLEFGLARGQRIVEDGAVTGAIITRDDITGEAITRLSLQRTQRVFESVGKHLPDIVVFANADGEIIECNQVTTAVTGWQRDELIGQPIAVLSAHPDGAEDRFASLWAAGGAHHGIRQVRRSDGSTFPVDVLFAVIGEDDGESVACLLVRDQTERIKREEGENRLQRLESLGVLAGGIAHDFNNILTGIDGRLSLALAYAGSAGPLPRLLTEAEDAVRQAARLTDQLLTFAKGGTPRLERVDLAQIVRSQAAFASSGTQTRLTYDFEDNLWDVKADVHQIGRVIQNLVLNAIQAMNGTGSIEMVLCNVEVTAGHPSSLEPGRYLQLRVTDDGPGIPVEALNSIFEPYFSTKETTGLGLAVAHSITQSHGGSISVASPAGSGATFIIHLPAADPDTVTVSSQDTTLVPQSREPHRALRVLVMDDDPVILELMAEMLGALGHESEAARDGEDAVHLFRTALDARQPFDVVLLDLTVRGGQGGLKTRDAVRELRPDVPVILMSGYSEEEVTYGGDALGAGRFLSKPFGLSELRRALENVEDRLQER